MPALTNSSFLPGFKRILFYTAILSIFSISAYARNVTLTWDPNSEPDLSHYVVYWGISSGDYSYNSGDIGLATEYSVEIPDDNQVYFFAVTAVDEAGLESDYSNEVSTGEVSSATPEADAGPGQNVYEGETVTLDGSGSIDPDGVITQWQWAQTAGTSVTLDDPSSAQPVFTVPSITESESLTFVLTVTDSDGLTDTDICIVNIVSANDPPAASAGSDQNVEEGMQVVLNGSGSMDADGSIASYRWIQTGGTTVELENAATMLATFTSPLVSPEGEALTFELTVTDDQGLKSTDTCIVNIVWVNDPPVAIAGSDQNVEEGMQVALNGSGSLDADGSIASYRWVQTGGIIVELDNPLTPQPSFTSPLVNPEGEALTFELTVTDDQGLKGTDSCIVNVVWVNNPPLADAGEDQNVTAGETVALDGSASVDYDGDILSYRWTQTGGTIVILDDPAAVNPSFTAPPVDSQGEILIFKLVITDDGGLKSSSECIIDVTPSPHVLPVRSGWNLVSISNSETATSIEEAFGQIMDKIISIWSFDEGAWRVYNPADIESSDLLEVEPGKGLWGKYA